MKAYRLSNSGESNIYATINLTLPEVKLLRKVIRKLNNGKADGHYPPFLYLGKGFNKKSL